MCFTFSTWFMSCVTIPRSQMMVVANDYWAAKWGLHCLCPGSSALASREAPFLSFLKMSALATLELFNSSISLAANEAHRQDLTEEQRVDGVDPPINSCAKGSKKHVGPLGGIVLEDPGHWSRLNRFLLLLLLSDGVLCVDTEIAHTHVSGRGCVVKKLLAACTAVAGTTKSSTLASERP